MRPAPNFPAPLIVPHVIVVERDDAVGVLVWSTPGTLLAMIAPHFPIGRTHSMPTHHAEVIAARVRLALRFAPGECWGRVEFEGVLAELESYDAESGDPIRRDDLEIDQRVLVAHVGFGVVRAFARSGRIVVDLDEPRGALHTVQAPRSLVKPVVRPCA